MVLVPEPWYWALHHRDMSRGPKPMCGGMGSAGPDPWFPLYARMVLVTRCWFNSVTFFFWARNHLLGAFFDAVTHDPLCPDPWAQNRHRIHSNLDEKGLITINGS